MKNRKVIVKLMGGLGNQMFQYAFALRISKLWDAELLVRFIPYNRTYGLDMFGIQLTENLPETEERISWSGNYEPNITEQLLEDSTKNNPSVISVAGYFQDERFFAGSEEAIRETFTLNKEQFEPNSVSVQIRLGDYRDPPILASLPPSYFHQCIKWFQERINNPRFYLFSDEVDRCHQYFQDYYNLYIIEADVKDTFRRSVSCRNSILSNSSFSWWSAWLGNKELVLRPDPMFPAIDWASCPDRWTKIPVNWDNVIQSEQWNK